MWFEAFLCYVCLALYIGLNPKKIKTDKNLFGHKIIPMSSHSDFITYGN